MHGFLFWLRRIVGVPLIAVGFLAGVVGACGTVVYTALWFYGEAASRGDHHTWAVCAGVGVGGGLALWAGVALLRAAHDGSFRLRVTGPQRRRSANAALRDTLVWLFIAAECCFIFVQGDMAAKVLHALQGTLAAYLGVHAIILLHELGHLGLAAILGFDLQKLQVGTGPLLLKGRFGGLRVEWRALLGGGLVLTADEREHGWRWRHWTYVAAGPVATASGCLALAWWIEQWHRDVSWFIPPNGVADIVAMYLCVHSALLWLFSVLPTKTRVGVVSAHTDGYKLLHVPRYSLETVRNVVVVTCMRRVELLWEDGQRALAWTRLREILARYPTLAALSVAEGYYLGEQGDHADAAASYARWLQTGGLPGPVRARLNSQRFSALARADEPAAARQCCEDALRELPTDHRTALLDELATEVLKHGLESYLPEADAWGRKRRSLSNRKRSP